MGEVVVAANQTIIPTGDGASGSARHLGSVDLKQLQSIITHTRQVGVVLPPPDIRAIIDKTASFVARNGEGPASPGAVCLPAGRGVLRGCSLWVPLGQVLQGGVCRM